MTRPMSVAVALGACLLLAACSSGTGTNTTPTVTAQPSTTTIAGTATTEAANGPAIVRFDLPAQVPCVNGAASATADYETKSANVVAFAVDQVSLTGGDEPPVSGRHDIPLSCGATHTVMLVAVGPAGQVVATRAVQVSPSDEAAPR